MNSSYVMYRSLFEFHQTPQCGRGYGDSGFGPQLRQRKRLLRSQKHALNLIEIVPQHCYIVEDNNQIIAVMALHPQDGIFEIEDFHIKQIQENKTGSWN